MSSIWEQIKNLSPTELERQGIITSAKVAGTYICPVCGNGSGKDGDGLTVKQYAWGYNYHCFKEGKNYTAVDLIKLAYGVDEAKVVEIAREKFGVEEAQSLKISTFNGKKEKIESSIVSGITAASIVAQSSKQALSDKDPLDTVDDVLKNYGEKLYPYAQGQLAGFLQSRGGTFRGLGFEDLQEVGGGYAYGKLILPYDDYHYFEREIEGKGKKYIKGSRQMYNPYDVDFKLPVIVTEGEIDCLSVHKVSGLPCIAVGSAINFKNLVNWLEKTETSVERIGGSGSPRLILIGDNDQTGQKNALEGVQRLIEAKYLAVSAILSPAEKYDANEWLQKDAEGLKKRLHEIYKQADIELKKISAQIAFQKQLEEDGGFMSAEDYNRLLFDDELEELKKVAKRKTGYKNLDEKQEILPGLYFIGAISSLGKTSFCLQWAEQMARLGETVLFCSYEMSLIELHSKVLARNVYLKNQHTTLTATQIRRGGNDSDLKAVRQELDLKNFRIAKFNFETIDELIEKLRKTIEKMKKPPTIFIDYLQFIRPSRELRDTSTKTAIDDIVMKLKIFQQETNAIIVVVSSFNRMNYTQTAAFESFKESGGVEYTADVLFALELYCTAELRGTQSSVQDDRKAIDMAKKEYPRKIRLKCLKNRVGGLYDCFFKFYMKNDYFEACTEADLKEQTQTKSAHRS